MSKTIFAVVMRFSALGLLAVCSALTQALEIHAQGLFNGAAVLVIDGNQQMLRAGKRSAEGVLLVSADPRQAVVEVDGKRMTLTLTRDITTQYNAPVGKPEISVRRNEYNQYLTQARINGRSVAVMVDTGANAVAMNSNDARMLGVDYESGIRTRVQTASGIANAYTVQLRSVSLGEIKVPNVRGFVIEGDFPQTVLLGMTFLEHVDLREEGGILYLQGKY